MCGQHGIAFCKKIQNPAQNSPKAGDTHVEFQKLSITGLQNCCTSEAFRSTVPASFRDSQLGYINCWSWCMTGMPCFQLKLFQKIELLLFQLHNLNLGSNIRKEKEASRCFYYYLLSDQIFPDCLDLLVKTPHVQYSIYPFL